MANKCIQQNQPSRRLKYILRVKKSQLLLLNVLPLLKVYNIFQYLQYQAGGATRKCRLTHQSKLCTHQLCTCRLRQSRLTRVLEPAACLSQWQRLAIAYRASTFSFLHRKENTAFFLFWMSILLPGIKLSYPQMNIINSRIMWDFSKAALRKLA